MKVLLITKIFPPTPGARSIQIEKVAKAIASKGCDLLVVCACDERINRKNLPKYDFAVEFIPSTLSKGKNGTLGRVQARVYSDLSSIGIMDSWVRKAKEFALERADSFMPDIIFSASTPFESHLVALEIRKELSNTPWIASFSDPWPSYLNPGPHKGSYIPLLGDVQRSLAIRVLETCNRVHMTNRYAIELLENQLKVSLRPKSVVIPHLGNVTPAPEGISTLDVISHIGNLSKERVSIPLLRAVKRAFLDHQEIFKGLYLVGKVCPRAQRLLKELQMQECSFCQETVLPHVANTIAQRSRALLVIEADMPFSPFLPSKFADYCSSGRPIIAITPKSSPIRDFLTKYPAGIATENDEDCIYNAIDRVFTRSEVNFQYCDVARKEFSEEKVSSSYLHVFRELKQSIT